MGTRERKKERLKKRRDVDLRKIIGLLLGARGTKGHAN